jgi:drug/metabolite transporter (DMT)-like permease
MKKGLLLFSNTEVAAIRLIVAGIVLLPFAIKRLKTVSKKEFFYISLSGIIGSGIPAFLFTIAQTHISSTEAAIYNSLSPVFTLLFAMLFFKTKVFRWNIWGVIIGLMGVIFLLLQKNQGDIKMSVKPEYGLLLVLATLMYGFNTNHVKNNLANVDGITITSIAFFVMLIPSIPFLANHTFYQKIHSPMFFISLFYIVILAVVGTAFALIIWNIFIKTTTAIFASAITYIIPIFALMWGLLDNEKFNLNHAIAILCIFAGIYLVNYKPKNAT